MPEIVVRWDVTFGVKSWELGENKFFLFLEREKYIITVIPA